MFVFGEKNTIINDISFEIFPWNITICHIEKHLLTMSGNVSGIMPEKLRIEGRDPPSTNGYQRVLFAQPEV